MIDSIIYVGQNKHGLHMYKLPAGVKTTDHCLERQLKSRGVGGWNGGRLSVVEQIKKVEFWADEQGELEYPFCLSDAYIVVDKRIELEKTDERFIIYNPLSSLPITTVYKSEKQAKKVAAILADKHNEPFFVAQIKYGFLRTDGEVKELNANECR